jgi:hypothetical protein
MAKRKAGTLSTAAKAKTEPTAEGVAQAEDTPRPKIEKTKKFKPTKTGYIKADGTKIQRLSVFLTVEQIGELKGRAGKANKSISEYVADGLGL